MTRLMGRAAWALLIVSVLVIGAAKGIGRLLPMGDLLAYTAGSDTASHLYLLDVDRMRVISPVDWSITEIAWSPDGEWLLVGRAIGEAQSRTYALYLWRIETDEWRLLFECSDFCWAIWSPDSTRLATELQPQLDILSLTGQVLARLECSDDCYNIQWSSNGSYLIFNSGMPTGVLHTHDAEIMFYLNSGAFWSPDGNWLAGQGELIHLDTNQRIRLGRDIVVYWSPIGGRVAFTQFDPEMNTNSIILTTAETPPVFFTVITCQTCFFAGWLPDGKHLLISVDKGALGIDWYVIEADRQYIDLNNELAILNTDGFGWYGWSPDSNILYVSDFPNNGGLDNRYEVDIVSRDGRLIFHGNNMSIPRDLPPWSPDGAWITVRDSAFSIIGVNLYTGQATYFADRPRVGLTYSWQPRP
jgi:dipeptidyl aminopeptidase/acylaminoacyl peptidase